MNIINVATSAIVTNPANPSSRTPDDELVESIKQNNILTPLLVRLDKESKKYVIIAGERRYRAALKLKLENVPVIVTEADGDKELSLLLTDNIHRKNMNPIEEYQVILRMRNSGMQIDYIAKTLSKDKKYVVRRLSLGNLTSTISKAVLSGAVISDRVLYLLAQSPQKVQTSVWQRYTSDVNGIIHWTRDDKDSERVIMAEIQSGLFRGEFNAEETVRLYGSGKVGVATMDTITKNLGNEELFDTTQNVPAENVQQAKEFVKAIKNGLVSLSTSTYRENSDTFRNKEGWRLAGKEDDPKECKEGIMVDGPKAGKLVEFVIVKPKKNTDKDTRTEKQIEQDRKERAAKRYQNRIANETLRLSFESLLNGIVKIDEKSVSMVFDTLGNNHFPRVLRCLMDKEEYAEVDYAKARQTFDKLTKDFKPERRLMLALLTYHVHSNPDVLSLVGVKQSDLAKKAKGNVDEEIKKAAAEREAKKVKK